MALFSATRPARPPMSEIHRRTGRGGGRAARGVSSWSSFCCVRFSVAVWCEEAPNGGYFSCFGRESPPRALPDRRPDRCDGLCRSAGLRSSPGFHFGDFAPRAWRVVSGIKKKKSRFFFDIAPARLVLFAPRAQPGRRRSTLACCARPSAAGPVVSKNAHVRGTTPPLGNCRISYIHD